MTGEFTGTEPDTTGLDYFGARYFSGVQGRFTSPDEPFADQHPEDPQSWNMYAYVRNNPLIYTDPTGRCKKGDDGKYHDSDAGPCVESGGAEIFGKSISPSSTRSLRRPLMSMETRTSRLM